MENKEVVLSVKDLKISFSTDHGYVQAVRGVSFDLYKGETLCIVGESGSGKSVTSKTIMGILASNGRIQGGSIMYEGEDLTKVSEDEFHRIRGHKIGMIFQDPLSSLNPIVRIGKQITEAMLINSSRLKKMYDELVSKELVAYKNSITKKRTTINGAKDKISFLKSEKKKKVNSIKMHATEIAEGKLYSLKLEYRNNVAHALETCKENNAPLYKELYALKVLIKKKTNDAINEAKKKNALTKGQKDREIVKPVIDNSVELARIAVLESQIKENKEKARQEIESLKKEYFANVSIIKEEKKKEQAVAHQKIVELKAHYNTLINEARDDYYRVKKDANETYNPLIKENKKAFKIRSKEAKKIVNNHKADLRKQYLASKHELELKLKEAKTEHAKLAIINEIKELKTKYISSIKITKKEAKERALKIMKEVGISEPEKRFRQYPFEFSGGMRQRIVIAIALTADPDILICDEPTTALDVTIQAQILELINRLKVERNLSCIFITHDLGVVANMADRVAVMYAGKIVEYGTEEDIFYDPRHPYTWALLSSIPDVDSKEKLEAIPGTPPNMIYPPVGDAFALRSRYAMAIDFKKEPPLFKISDSHYAATWLLDERAPKVEMPQIVKTRIENSLKARGGK